MNILEQIKLPDDLKTLEINELNKLCEEIREFLTDSVSKTGGHLASNLGIVELTVALHKVFNLPKDKIIFDVGHQSYVHKILTGRKDKFNTLRQFKGLSGFPKQSESEYDCFNTGHSSTSISAALGLARAGKLTGNDYRVAAVFGDGSLTGGMMFEAMNDAGRQNIPLILILNDNTMSISKNVGSVSKHLQNIRISSFYFKSKNRIEDFLINIPIIGKVIVSIMREFKSAIRRMIIPTTLFEEMGFVYLGPVDGHDLESVISCLENARDLNKPVVVHVHTKKGKGYIHAENNPTKFHGLGKFDKSTGETPPSSPSYSDCFGEKLCRIADKNKNVVAITGAMPVGTGLLNFSKQFPERFFDVGIAEEHAVTLAAGMAAGGLNPVVPLYSSFLQRAYDQTLHDVCLQNLHVVFPIDRAGIVGADGETHQGLYDIAYLMHMPNMSILSPSSLEMLEDMLDYAINQHNGPIAIRYPRGNAEYPSQKFEYGKAITHCKGNKASIIVTGRILKKGIEAAKALNNDCDVIEIPTIKPLDIEAIISSASKTGNVITIEDGVLIGGIGQYIAYELQKNNVNVKFRSFGFPDVPVTHGTVDELDKMYGVDTQSIIHYTKNSIEK